jgi:uncharacterized repeat protein (TIGR03803 family)
MHSFPPTGIDSAGGLTQATDGNLYGTTVGGGTDNFGAIFRITPKGALTTLYNFVSSGGVFPNGDSPNSGLLLGTDANLYGTTAAGGSSDNCLPAGSGCGTIFNLNISLAPFVTTLPTSTIVGAKVLILGNNLTGTSAVSFNGTPATFAVGSDTYLTATVPAGATTGSVHVTTPSGPLTSNPIFRVTPQILSFLPPSGAVGSNVVITGQSLTGASAVSFGGVLATSFTVNSYTQITATVPVGAKSGVIAVRTAGGRVQNTTSFTVTP